jgi:Fur family ferric uptake transcriptional regulator
VRHTRQKAALSRVLAEGDVFRSAQDLHADLRAAGEPVGLTTIYQQLKALTDAGEVDAVRGATGEMVYRACGGPHHHHLVCRECGASVEVDGPEIETLVARVATAHGYTQMEHTVELFGRCPACA